MQLRFSLAIQLMLFSAILVLLSVSVSTWLAYQHSKQELAYRLGNELLAIVNTLATQINGDEHDGIIRVSEDFIDNESAFIEIRKQLLDNKEINQLNAHNNGSPLYTLRPTAGFSDNGLLEFVVMTDTGDDGNFFIGNLIMAEPHHHRALAGQSSATPIYEDEEGTWISAAAPVYDSQGNVVALLQADRSIDFFQVEVNQLGWQLMIGAIVTSLVTALLAWLFAYHVSHRLNKVVHAAKQLGQGNLDNRATVTGRDEVASLAETFNLMAEQLQSAFNQTQKQKSYLQRASQLLANSNQKLEQLVDKRTKQLQQRNEALQHTLEKLQRSQATLVQSEKMASLGMLAAGVAHEINNPMAFVTSNVSTLKDYFKRYQSVLRQSNTLVQRARQLNDPRLQNAVETCLQLYKKHDIDFVNQDISSLIDETLTGAERVQHIVNDLKSFSHMDNSMQDSINVNDLIDTTLNVIQPQFDKTCTIIRNYELIPNITANPGKLNQVFLHLIMNAVDAMADQGVLTITTKTTDDYVSVSFTDTGCGISDDQQQHLFDAFYTTKVVGKGTGLGLYVVMNIVNEHGGSINVSSQIDQGSTFTLQLPIIQHNLHAAI